jgi:hypothetical protein
LANRLSIPDAIDQVGKQLQQQYGHKPIPRKRRRKPISSAGRLIPVELAARKSPKQHEPSCGLAVLLPGGRRIEVHPDFDTSTFERLVGILERR